MATTHRTVVESKRFSQKLGQIKSNPHKADELVGGVKWVLARDPHQGTRLGPTSQVWFIPVDLPQEPKIGVYYTFDADTVHLLSIQQP